MDCFQDFQSCQQGDVGVSIVITVVDPDDNPIDLATATEKKIRMGAPDGTSVDQTASFLTDGSDGKIVYVTIADDLEQVGEYELQGIITMGGVTKSTAVSKLQVLANVPPPVEPEP